MENTYIEYVKGLLEDAHLNDRYNVRLGVVTSREFEQRFINAYYFTKIQRGSFLGFPHNTENPIAVIANLPSPDVVSRLDLVRLYSAKTKRVRSDKIEIVPSKINPLPRYEEVVIDDLAELKSGLEIRAMAEGTTLEILVREPAHYNMYDGLSQRLGFADIIPQH
jgi:hypothetical protein